MAELRSFLVGVVIAGMVLLVGGVAFGVFDSGSSGSPSVRLLGTPPATRTPPPAVTRDPSQFTPVAPVETPEVPEDGTPAEGETPQPDGSPVGGETPAVEDTPAEIPTAAPTLETAPTEPPPPTQPSQAAEAQAYVETMNEYTPALVAQLDYLAGNAGAPSIASPDWRNFTIESAQTVQSLAASIVSVGAPGCVSEPHNSLLAAANQASGAAGAVIAAVNSNAPNEVSAQVGALIGARDGVDGAVAAISGAVGAC